MNTIEWPKVEKGIPVPPPVKAPVMHRGRPMAPWRLFLAGLACGDSFKALETSEKCIRNHANALGIELRVRKTGEMAEHNTAIVRVWRV